MKMPQNAIQYSDRYYDDKFEYRHVILPKELASLVPINFLMTETEWRNLGVHQSPGWRQYSIFELERHILLFKRPITKVE